MKTSHTITLLPPGGAKSPFVMAEVFLFVSFFRSVAVAWKTIADCVFLAVRALGGGGGGEGGGGGGGGGSGMGRGWSGVVGRGEEMGRLVEGEGGLTNNCSVYQ